MFDFLRKAHRFRQIPQADDCETLISDEKEDDSERSQGSRWTTSKTFLLFIWFLSILISMLVGMQIGLRLHGKVGNVDGLCTARVSQYCKQSNHEDDI